MTLDPQAQSSNHTSSPGSQGCPTPDEDKAVVSAFKYSSKQYESLASQFNTFVTISIFAVATIIAIVSFVRDTVDTKEGDSSTTLWQFEVGKFLCMVVIGLHFGVIIVGGRAWALCFRLAADCDAHSDLEAGLSTHNSNFDSTWDHIDQYRQVPFYRYVAYCERAQLTGTLLLLISMLIMQFILFSEKALSWIFLGVPVVLISSIYLTGFWDVSVTKAYVKDLFTKVPGWCSGKFRQ